MVIICYNLNHMMKDSPTYRALSNAFFSMISFGWPILIAIFVTPFVVNNLGAKEYGIYLFISTLIGLAGLLDVGIASSLGKFIAEENGRGNLDEIKKICRVGNSIFLVVGIVGATGIASTVLIGNFFFTKDIAQYIRYTPAFLAAAGMFFVTSIMSLYIIIPTALQRVDAGVRVGLYFFTTQQLLLVVLIMFNYGVNSIFVGLLALYIFFYYFYYKMAKNLVHPDLRVSLLSYGWDKAEVVHFYAFGIKVFMNNLANSSLTFLDKIVMPIFMGPSYLTYYGIAGSVANKTPAVSNTFANVIFPMAATFEGSGDRDRTKLLYVRSMRLITILSFSITITILSFPYKMLEYWISTEVAVYATNTLIVLAWTNLILSLTGPLTNLLVGMGRLKALTTTSVSAAVLNAILLFALIPVFGIYGAALAYLCALVPYLFLFYWTEIKLLCLERRFSFYSLFILKLSVASVATYIFNTYIVSEYITNLTTVLVGSTISIIFFITFFYVFRLFEKEDVRDLKLFARSLLKTIKNKVVKTA